MTDHTETNNHKAPPELGGSDSRRLLSCPCGEVPESLHVIAGDTCKWAFAYGGCCGEWHVEFRTEYHDIESPECMDLAVDKWNAAQRAMSS